MTSGIYWHAYHAPFLLFWVADYEDRVRCIRELKPLHEHADRLKWFQLVKGKLPAKLVAAFETRGATWKALIDADKAQARYPCSQTDHIREEAEYKNEKASVSLLELRRKYSASTHKLHVQECPDCSWDGTSLIFRKYE